MKNDSDSDLDERVEILKQKYLQKTSQALCAPPAAREEDGGLSDVWRRGHTRPHSEDELSDEERSPEETRVFCTETDVTLPSDLLCSSASSGLSGRRARETSGAAAVRVYQEMLHIYERLQAERVSQQAWAVDLCERERQLQQQEHTLAQQQRRTHTLSAEQQELRRVQTLQQQYEQEKTELEAALKQKTKENKRMRASFDSLRELNDSMKKQLNDLSEQNRKLECQSRKVQARLENLQRKCESSTTHRARDAAAVPRVTKAEPEHRPSSGAAGAACARGPELRLLSLLLDWITEGPLAEFRDGPNISAPLQERCAKVLPVLVDQLHQCVLDESLRFSLLRCIYCCLLCVERSAQLLLSSTLRRLGEEVSRGSADAGRAPLFRSSCLHTRLLCSLIVIRTVSRVDVLAQAVDVLSRAVLSDEGQALFVEYRALPALLALLRGGRPGLIAPTVDVLLHMSSESRVQAAFLQSCGCEEFFRCAALLLRSPRLETQITEKILTLLQRLSCTRKNRRLFEVSSLRLLLQELQRTTHRDQSFISINLNAILLNLTHS